MLYSFLSDKNYCDNDSNYSCLVLNPSNNLSHSFNKLNIFSSDISNTSENIINSKYYDINQLPILKEFTDKSSFSLSSEDLLSPKTH